MFINFDKYLIKIVNHFYILIFLAITFMPIQNSRDANFQRQKSLSIVFRYFREGKVYTSF